MTIETIPVPRAAHPLAGGGEMGAVMRATDWSKTPIGPVEAWSPTLRTTVSFLLANRFPLLLWWGSQYTSIYNDAYRPILGEKHPKSMGQPVSECCRSASRPMQSAPSPAPMLGRKRGFRHVEPHA